MDPAPSARSGSTLLSPHSTFSSNSMARTQSLSFPAERRNSAWFPSSSTMVWIFVFRPFLIHPTALSAVFPRHWRSCTLMQVESIHPNPQTMREIRFTACRHPTIWRIGHTLTARGRRPPTVPATGHHFGQSSTSRSASFGCPCGAASLPRFFRRQAMFNSFPLFCC